MVAYSFQKRFVEPIRWGLGLDIPDGVLAPKRQTIRAEGKKRHARPGELIQLYYGLRTKHARRIGVARCTSVSGIRIQVGLGIISVDDYPAIRDDADLDAFAQLDGFADWPDMRQFWIDNHVGVQFTGLLIKWEPLS